MKYNLDTGRHATSHFWRTYDRREIDLVEDYAGRLNAAEMKWSPVRLDGRRRGDLQHAGAPLLAEPVALARDRQHVALVQQAVEDGGGHHDEP